MLKSISHIYYGIKVQKGEEGFVFLAAWEMATLFSPEGHCKGGYSNENEKLAYKMLGTELVFLYVGQLHRGNLFCLRCPCITP